MINSPNLRVVKSNDEGYCVKLNDIEIASFFTLESAERWCWSKPCRDIVKHHLDNLNK